MKLVIFDLDQTLVDFISVHDEVTSRLFRRHFGVGARLTEIDFTGRSLTENLHRLARLKNVPEEVFQGKMQQFLDSYDVTFGESLPEDGEKHVLPGVRQLLDELAKTQHIIVLYTGGSRGVVDRVFRATSLGKYFRFCFYGTEVAARADMVRQAIRRAEEATGREFSGQDIVIIGDSVRDIECGKLFGALTIAVATGFHSRSQLSAAGTDYLFENLANYQEVLKAIG